MYKVCYALPPTTHHPSFDARSQMTRSHGVRARPWPAPAHLSNHPTLTTLTHVLFLVGLLCRNRAYRPFPVCMHVFVLIFERARSEPRGLWASRTRAHTREHGSPCTSDLLLRRQGHAALRLEFRGLQVSSSGGGRLILLLHDAVDADADQRGNDRPSANCAGHANGT
eukprot:scaffold3733_cov53-Phaeocystis_antarctica.AAC.2